MKKLLKFFGIRGAVGLGVVLTVIAALALSWIITCGIVYLITLLFGWTFTWAIATGIWLVMMLARTVFSHSVTVKK